ncbi:hypothetical protein GTG23_07035 [Rhodococcus hoagii]|nr:hypothetical protein [Prescottella equi]NKZ63089.1 hypothetical protein [Prescottella equi]NKZ64016.1 hypothetical protein [Prescottella equi]
MSVCKHCGKPIAYRAGLEWRHTARNTIWCQPQAWSNSTIATPKEAS